MDELTEKGIATVDKLLGPGFGKTLFDFSCDPSNFGAPLAEIALKTAFAQAWGRAGMDARRRSIAVISSLITQRQPSELRMHVRIGLNNGLSRDDLEDVLVILAPYVGLPAVSAAKEVMVQVLRERGIETGPTAAEGGLKY